MKLKLAAALGCTAICLLLLIPPHLQPFNFPADDAYFYLQVAWHIVHGHGSTFNQITPTNGYHPLWMVLCVLGTALAGGGRAAAIHAVFLIQQLMALGIAALALHVLGLLKVRNRIIAVPVLANFFLTGLFGSEAHANGLFVLLTLWSLLSPSLAARPWRGLAVGVLAGCAVLARLDNVFFAAAVFPFFLAQVFTSASRPGRRVLADVALFAAGWALIVGPYLIFNKLTYGHLTPISGAIKSTFPHPTWSFAHLGALGQLSLLAAPVLAVLLQALARDPVRRRFGQMLCLAVVLHAAYIVFFTRDVTHWSWYYVLGVINMAFCGAMLADELEARLPGIRFPGRRLAFGRCVAAGAVLMLLLGVGRAWIRAANPDAIYGRNVFTIQPRKAAQRWQVELAGWLQTHLPPGSRILVYDWPGTLAYLSGQAILPVDGLIGDYPSQDELLSKGIGRYLADHKIEYWLGPDTPDRDERPGWYGIRRAGDTLGIEIFSTLHKKSAGVFRVRDSARLVRFQEVLHHPDTPPLALWRTGAANGAVENGAHESHE